MAIGVVLMNNRLNDVWTEFENEFKSFKKRMDKRFTSLEKDILFIEGDAADMFQKIMTRLIDFIINAICFIFGVLITVFHI
jgi:hypothetical protein